MIIGKIINIYPFFFSDYLFYPLDQDNELYEKNLEFAVEAQAEFGSYENYLSIPVFSDRENESVGIVICGNGLGYFRCEHEVRDGDGWMTSVQSLISSAENEIEALKRLLENENFRNHLDKYHLTSNIEISYIYSHNFIIEKSTEKVKKNLGHEKPQAENLANIKYFYCNSTANIFEFSDKEIEYFLNLCADITVFSASVYIIQDIALKESMKLIKDKFLVKDEASITEVFHTKVSYFNQHLVNMKGMNFVDNVLVDKTAGRIAAEWGWESVLISSERAVEHFSNQISKVENENKRKSDRKENMILLGFTLLSIISTVAVLIELYDLQNNIDPEYRIIAVTLAFIMSIGAAYRYLTKK